MNPVRVYIDFENIHAVEYDQIAAAISLKPYRDAYGKKPVIFDIGALVNGIIHLHNQNKGEIIKKIAYCNWNFFGDYGSAIVANGIICRQVFSLKTQKDQADASLMMDAVHDFSDGKAGIAYIVSNDGDFVPLVVKLKEMGVQVIVIGNEGCSSCELRQVSDQFITCESVISSVNGKVKFNFINEVQGNENIKIALREKMIPELDKWESNKTGFLIDVIASLMIKHHSWKLCIYNVRLLFEFLSSNDSKFRIIRNVEGRSWDQYSYDGIELIGSIKDNREIDLSIIGEWPRPL